MKLNSNAKNAVEQFQHIGNFKISNNNDDGQIDLFLFPINARNFDYEAVANNLLEAVADYALSRKTIEECKDSPMSLSRQARNKFKDYTKNKGELGELLLFCFLEGHLEAPKILTKLELKTSKDMYVHGSDGVHLYKLSELKYQLIFGESKTYKNMLDGFRAAFESISNFKNSYNGKSNIDFEKGLISTHLDTFNFDKNDEDVINKLLYPSKKGNNNVKIDDAFALFLGFEIDIQEECRNLPNDEFEIEIKKKVIDQVKKHKNKIYEMINKNDLLGHTFYVYILPFTDIENNRKSILEAVLS